MLVLTRKVGEQIVIGNNIVITVVEVRGDKTRLGITAPKDVPVDRQEVHEKKMAGPKVEKANLGVRAAG